MSGAMQGSPLSDLRAGRDGLSSGELVSRVIASLLIVAFATGVALALSQGQRAESIIAVYAVAILAVALMQGLLQALLATAAALMASHLLLAAHGFRIDLSGKSGALLVLLAIAITITGRYTDLVARRVRSVNVWEEQRRRAESLATAGVIGEIQAASEPVALGTPQSSMVDDGLRVFTSFCIVGAGLAGAVLARQWIGGFAATLCIVASIVSVAGVLGGRFGFASGVFAALILNIDPGHGEGAGDTLAMGFEMATFAAFGLGVGKLADQLQRERLVLTTLLAAGRELSSRTGENEIRRVLIDSLSALGPGARIQIADEGQGPVLSHPTAPEQGWPAVDPRWRVRRLAADGRDVGVVRWRYSGSDARTADADEIAHSLIDLGASAIVRARLNVEKGDMEFAARTEQLRMILLDAVSHHFRSPLTGILGSVTSTLNLPEDQDPKVRREFLLIIKEQAHRLSRYVDSFLSVARLESGAIEVNLADVNLETLVYDVWETFGETGGSRRFLQVEIDGRSVRADPGLLAQVLGNVLENAIKYSPEGSVVEVWGRTVGDKMVIDIADRGPGVPAQSLGRIFDRFYRSQGASAPGLGLGLYITHSLVGMLGGAVEARNRSDGQSGFVLSISLPLAEVPN